MQANKLVVIAIGCAAVALAQDKITVPISNPSQPVKVIVELMNGNITVTPGTGSQVIVESTETQGRRRGPEPPPGMHRIDGGGTGLDATEDHNTITISGRSPIASSNVTVQVPPNSSLRLNTMVGGRVEVMGINGEIEVDNTNGPIVLKNVSGSVVAHSLNGGITASVERATADKPMSFTSLNGKIDVTLPGEAKARLRIKTDNGSVFSDFDVKVDSEASKPVVTDSRSKGGKYRIRVDRGVYGSINGGGPEYRFETMNGDILIHKK